MPKKKSKSKTLKHSSGAKQISGSGPIKDEAIVAALSTVPPPVLIKVCRLCETKDGPFLNIFDADKVIAKKIEELMPFGIAENDDLPHKICFRCSAKVEELHEFIQKCIRTQENLQKAIGMNGPLTMKSRNRVVWEQELNRNRMSNDDICDVLIKRAMEGIPLNAPLDNIDNGKPLPAQNTELDSSIVKKSSSNSKEPSSDDDPDDVSLNQVKLSIVKSGEVPVTRISRSSKADGALLDGIDPPTRKSKKSLNKPAETKPADKTKSGVSNTEVVPESKKEAEVEIPKEPVPQFNIMDHVSVIKVNGVGILFQCKLCNRNFLKKEIVMNHGCSKNNVPKEIKSNNTPRLEAPKPPSVKYIKMDKDFKKPIVSNPVSKTVEKLPVPDPPKVVEPEIVPKPKPKPRIGPASRVKNDPPKPPSAELTPPPNPSLETPVLATGTSMSIPSVPSLSSRYKLIPGPNNTFTLVEELNKPETKPIEDPPAEDKPQSRGKKRKTEEYSSSKSKSSRSSPEKSSSPELVEVNQNQQSQSNPEPYPVGLFVGAPIPHHSGVGPSCNPPVPFTTPAMKKQSYTIVQTGNPSKLLLSTKSQPVEETSKKKSKKKIDGNKEPYNVALEETSQPKDPGFFTFISVDPLLQPSYVLPTDNIIQESQISTSTPGAKSAVEKDKGKYSCNMCGEHFSREKKLLTHIQSHYNQMDEEDQMRAEKTASKKKTRRT